MTAYLRVVRKGWDVSCLETVYLWVYSPVMARAEVEVHHRCDLSVCPFVCQQDFLEKDDFMKLVFSFVPIQTISSNCPFTLFMLFFRAEQ